MELVKPTLEMKAAYLDFAADWEASGEEITPYAARLLGGESYEAWVERNDQPRRYRQRYVPSSVYFLTDGGEIVGAIDIRHHLNDDLLRDGGHIGYGVRPSRRRQGNASTMLKMALPVAKGLGFGRALITCDKANVASARTIRKNGGALENEVPDGERITQRYWIDLTK